jgi:hypothetical protein
VHHAQADGNAEESDKKTESERSRDLVVSLVRAIPPMTRSTRTYTSSHSGVMMIGDTASIRPNPCVAAGLRAWRADAYWKSNPILTSLAVERWRRWARLTALSWCAVCRSDRFPRTKVGGRFFGAGVVWVGDVLVDHRPVAVSASKHPGPVTSSPRSRIAPDLTCRTPENRPASYRRALYRRQPMAARLVAEVRRQLGRGRTCPESETDQTSAIGHG